MAVAVVPDNVASAPSPDADLDENILFDLT